MNHSVANFDNALHHFVIQFILIKHSKVQQENILPVGVELIGRLGLQSNGYSND